MNDMSQFGEGKVLSEYFASHPPAHMFLVDVGALGMLYSNTWCILKSGWKGVVIDADPFRTGVIRREFEGLEAEVVQVGVGDEECEMDFHLHRALGHNSFVPGWYPATATDKTVKVKVRPLAGILDERRVPLDFDLLSVDTEGMDERIVKAMFAGSRYRPRVIVTECTSYSDHEGLFAAEGYGLVARTGNPEYGNLVYARNMPL